MEPQRLPARGNDCGGPWHEPRYGALFCCDCGTDLYPDTTAPRRLHIPRGQKKPAGTVLVCRPYRYGNPFDFRDHGRAQAVALHAEWITNPASEPIRLGKVTYRPATVEQIRADLAGKNLACRCPDDGQPCHAATLLAIANPKGTPQCPTSP